VIPDVPAASKRPVVLAAIVGVVVGGAIAGGIALALSGAGGGHTAAPPAGGSSTTRPGPTSTIAAPTDPGARQLVQLLTTGAGLAFHATYEASGPQFQTKLDLWHNGQLSRRDTDTTTPQGEIQTLELGLPDKDVRCVHSGTVPWTCTPTPIDPKTSASDLTFGNASKFFQNITLTPSTTTLNGRAAICFTAPPSGGAAGTANRFCTTPQGIPLLIDTGQGPITLVALDMTPPATSVFTTPQGAVGV
jgi:hypothetical protein